MNNTIKVEKKNEKGKTIVKEITKDMLQMYLSIGWTKVENKKPFKPIQSSRLGNDE